MFSETIALCIISYNDTLPMVVETVSTTRPYVDEAYIQINDYDEDWVKTFRQMDCHIVVEPWKDNFSDYKNKCCNHAMTGWVLSLDHDEIPTSEMARHLRSLVEHSEGGLKYNIVGFDCIDETIMPDGRVERQRWAGKELLHVNFANPFRGEVHVWTGKHPWIGIRVSYPYIHRKQYHEVLQRATRNIFLGGGGDTWAFYQPERCPQWFQLRRITDSLGIKTWRDFDAYLKRGSIDERLKDWIRSVRHIPWHDEEYKHFFTYYFEWLHLEEGI